MRYVVNIMNGGIFIFFVVFFCFVVIYLYFFQNSPHPPQNLLRNTCFLPS